MEQNGPVLQQFSRCGVGLFPLLGQRRQIPGLLRPAAEGPAGGPVFPVPAAHCQFQPGGNCPCWYIRRRHPDFSLRRPHLRHGDQRCPIRIPGPILQSVPPILPQDHLILSGGQHPALAVTRKHTLDLQRVRPVGLGDPAESSPQSGGGEAQQTPDKHHQDTEQDQIQGQPAPPAHPIFFLHASASLVRSTFREKLRPSSRYSRRIHSASGAMPLTCTR